MADGDFESYKESAGVVEVLGNERRDFRPPEFPKKKGLSIVIIREFIWKKDFLNEDAATLTF